MLSAKFSRGLDCKRDIRSCRGGRAGSQTGSARALLDDDRGRVSYVATAIGDSDGATRARNAGQHSPSRHNLMTEEAWNYKVCDRRPVK